MLIIKIFFIFVLLPTQQVCPVLGWVLRDQKVDFHLALAFGS